MLIKFIKSINRKIQSVFLFILSICWDKIKGIECLGNILFGVQVGGAYKALELFV